VQDTGCGITRSEQEKLFNRFTQATPKTHVKYGGSGLGLYISKSLAELQGGCIGVHSELNVGSTFAFFVESRIVSPLDGLERRFSNSLLRDPSVSVEEIVRAAKLTVLVVEDNLVNVSRALSWSTHVI